ncbi:MAG TPA: hypothetical protein ACFYEF_03025 [Candidatus Wunengus sp. YC63]|uniref:hypothetical protein n=1 Tax=unclassified Candidatus Wunengus TaxID=3367695 RepID=UPI004026A63F
MRLLKNFIHRVFRLLLRFFFRFDKWHLSTLYDRKYAQDIITYLNSHDDINRKSAIEIGCGLGDIIGNLKYNKRLGLDSDKNVLKAAIFLSKITFDFKIHFQHFLFPTSTLSGKHDAIIMVNWIHHVSPAVLKNNINIYYNKHLNTKGEIIIDTVQSRHYEYNHSIDYLTEGLACLKIKLGNYENGREIFAIKNYI